MSAPALPADATAAGDRTGSGPLGISPSDRWHFHRILNLRAHEEVVEQLTFAILSGAFKPGERLPNIEALAREMQVSKPVVGEALKVLTSAGVVRARRGMKGGLQLITDNVPDSIMARTAPLWHVAVNEIVEARRPVEMQLALLAGERATADDLSEIESCIDRLRDHRDSELPLRIRFDHLFHYTIGRAARSEALALYQHQILEQLFVRVREYFEGIEDVDSVIRLHETTLGAIANRDPDRIRHAIDEHLTPLEQAIRNG